MHAERRARRPVDGRRAVRPEHAHAQARSGSKQSELDACVDRPRADDERTGALRLVVRKGRLRDEGLLAEGQVAHVRLRGIRGLVGEAARALVARARPRLDDLAADLGREVQMRPARVPARRRPAELLTGHDVLPALQLDPLAEVTVDGEAPRPVLEHHVVVERRDGRSEAAVVLSVLDGEDPPLERCEDRHADVHLAKAPNRAVRARVTVVGLRPAVEVADPWPGIEIDEVRRVQVLPEDPRLREEGHLTGAVRSAGTRRETGHDEREDDRDEHATPSHRARHGIGGQRTETGVPTSTKR